MWYTRKMLAEWVLTTAPGFENDRDAADGISTVPARVTEVTTVSHFELAKTKTLNK